MAYSWQQNQTNEKGKYSWQNGGLQPTLEEKVKTEKEGLIKQGLPVSVRKDRATPTMGGSILRGALNPVADIAKNLTMGANLDNKYLGKVEGLGQVDLSKAPWEKENLKVIGKSAATGLELGSYATGGSAVVGAGKNAVKQTAKEFLKTSGKQLVKEGAITSGLGSIGYQGREGKINPLTVARDTAIGAVAAPLLGVGFNKLFGKGASKVADEVIPPTKEIEKSVVQIVDNKTGKLEYKVIPKGQLKDFDNLIDNTETGIAGKEIDGKIYHLTAKTPESMEARGFTNSGIAKLDEIPTTTPKAEQSVIKQPKSQKTGTDYEPDFTFNAEENFKKTDPNYTPTTFKEIKDNYVQLSKTVSTDDLIDISMGKKEVPQGLTKTSIYELTKNRKDLTIEQIKRLKNIAPESEAGLNLVTVKLREGGIIDNPTDFIQATEKVMKEKASKAGITRKTIGRFLDDIECK